MKTSDLPPINRTSYFSKKSINPENDGHENQRKEPIPVPASAHQLRSA